MEFQVFNLKGINTKMSPFAAENGQLTRCVNMYTDEVGAKTKRWGYSAFLDNVDSADVDALFQYQKNDGTTNFLYRASGTSIYYYNLGVGTATTWTPCTNGTMTSGAYTVGNTTFDDVLIIGDGIGSTRHSTDGTAFVFTGGTSGTPPIGQYITNAFGRVFIGGTASDVFYSSANNGTIWLLSGAYDSSSFKVTGGGKINGVQTVADRIIVTKTNGRMKKWDDYQLSDVPSANGYIAESSISDIDGYLMGLSSRGVYGFGGDRPELLSNPIEYQIFNSNNTGIVNFYNAVGGQYRYKYFLSVGNVADGRNGNMLSNCTLVYDAQLDEWYNWQFDYHTQEAFLTYKDNSGKEYFAFGDFDGQVYKFSSSDTGDAGQPIRCLLEGFIHANAPQSEKVWKKIDAFANPGCEAALMLAAADSFDTTQMNWVSVGALKQGVLEYRGALRGRFLFYRVIESSATKPFTFYGFNVSADIIGD